LAVDVIIADMAVMAAKAVKTVMAGELWRVVVGLLLSGRGW